jgi:hypothetical protein
MNPTTRTNLANLRSQDGDVRYEALLDIIKATDKRVDWANDVWDELLENLRDKDAHQRAIAAQLLCNLAKSDTRKRMLKDFDAVLAVTRDEKFVTARHTLQSLWKVGGPERNNKSWSSIVWPVQRLRGGKELYVIRCDIIQDLRKLYDEVKDEKIRDKALELIATEDGSKYRKKYAAVWRPG